MYSHFSQISVLLAIFHVLWCVFLIIHDFSFLFIIQILQCAFLIFHLFQCFSPYCRSYSVRVSSFTYFSLLDIHLDVSTLSISHFQVFHGFLPYLSPTVFVYHFSRFSVFLTLIQVLQCVFLIFHVFHFLSTIYQVL